MSRRQDGQALVGALVVTTLAFLMAGAVAVGASALLGQETNSHNASSGDLATQDALTAAVAAVAGGSGPCSGTSSPLAVQRLPSGYAPQVVCLRVDGVQSGALTLLQLRWLGSCAVYPVSGYSNNRVLIWFSAEGNAKAWVDNSQSGCKEKKTVCADSGTGSVTQLLLDCDFTADQDGTGKQGGLYLHVQSTGQSPVLARLAQHDGLGGSVYVLAASTGVPGGPADEEADIWISQDGATTALRFEGTL